MRREEFLHEINDYLEISAYSDRSINGLQVAGSDKIEKVATAVSASEKTICEAVSLGVDALLVHHGLFWQGDSYVVDRAKKRKLEQLFHANINLIAYHIPLDAHQEIGNNWKAARDLNWSDLQPFGEYKGRHIGVSGAVESIHIADLQGQVGNYYNHQPHSALGGPDYVSRVALISGGAHWQIIDAIKADMDVFITGSFDEPIWNIAHEEGIHFLAFGHAATERIGPRALADYITQQFALESHFIEDTNPF